MTTDNQTTGPRILTGMDLVNATNDDERYLNLLAEQAERLAEDPRLMACTFFIPNPANPDDVRRCTAWLDRELSMKYAMTTRTGDIIIPCPRDRKSGSHTAVKWFAVNAGWYTAAQLGLRTQAPQPQTQEARQTKDRSAYLTDAQKAAWAAYQGNK